MVRHFHVGPPEAGFAGSMDQVLSFDGAAAGLQLPACSSAKTCLAPTPPFQPPASVTSSYEHVKLNLHHRRNPG